MVCEPPGWARSIIRLFKHAARMYQWRRRRAASAKIVTHHSSQATLGDAVLTGNESPPAISPDSHNQVLYSSRLAVPRAQRHRRHLYQPACTGLALPLVLVTLSGSGAPGLCAPQPGGA
jgi:hypothetical protein